MNNSKGGNTHTYIYMYMFTYTIRRIIGTERFPNRQTDKKGKWIVQYLIRGALDNQKLTVRVSQKALASVIKQYT